MLPFSLQLRPSLWNHARQIPYHRRLKSGSSRHLLRHPKVTRRHIRILGIETSCDDTSVAVLKFTPNHDRGTMRCEVEHHARLTADNLSYGGIHPLRSLESHQANLAAMVQRAVVDPPDLIAVTRGPGMRASLSCGIDFAKGLSVAWGRPLIGIHHMQAHALSARLSYALSAREFTETSLRPAMPVAVLLVSGGHTLLAQARSPSVYSVLARTTDIAIGDCLDKAARSLLPQSVLAEAASVSYGQLLEDFALSPRDPPQVDCTDTNEMYGWSIKIPAMEDRPFEFSFSGIPSQVSRIVEFGSTHQTPRTTPISVNEAKDLAKAVMTAAFEHLADRVLRSLVHWLGPEKAVCKKSRIRIAVGGGVAANSYLRVLLKEYLEVRGVRIALHATDPAFCTDNAAMIAWTAAESVDLFKEDTLGQIVERFRDPQQYLKIRALRKWSLENISAPWIEEMREKEEEIARDARKVNATESFGSEDMPENDICDTKVTTKAIRKATKKAGVLKDNGMREAVVQSVPMRVAPENETSRDLPEDSRHLQTHHLARSDPGRHVAVGHREEVPQASLALDSEPSFWSPECKVVPRNSPALDLEPRSLDRKPKAIPRARLAPVSRPRHWSRKGGRGARRRREIRRRESRSSKLGAIPQARPAPASESSILSFADSIGSMLRSLWETEHNIPLIHPVPDPQTKKQSPPSGR